MNQRKIVVKGLNPHEQDMLMQRLAHMKRTGVIRQEVEITEG